MLTRYAHVGLIVMGAALPTNGVTVCDGLDPEGNVIQFREDAG